MSEITPVTHTEKVVAGQVDAVTHFEKVIAKYGGGGGGGGFTPTDAQLDAMNSGITSEDVEQIATNENNILLKANTSDVNTATANLQAQINNIITPVTQDAEVENARVGADSTSYQTLKARLDAEYNNQEVRIENIDKVIDKISEGYGNFLPVGTFNPTNVYDVDFTYNNGVISKVGTATSTTTAVFDTISPINLKVGTYSFSSSPSTTTFMLKDGEGNTISQVNSGTNGTFTLNEDTTLYLAGSVTNGNTYNTSFSLMLAKGAVSQPFTLPERTAVDSIVRGNVEEISTDISNITEIYGNLLPNTSGKSTIYEVEFNYNNGVISKIGTGTATTSQKVTAVPPIVLKAGTYTFYSTQSTSTFALKDSEGTTISTINSLTNGTFTLEAETTLEMYSSVNNGTTYNATFNIALVKGYGTPTWSAPSVTAVDKYLREFSQNNLSKKLWTVCGDSTSAGDFTGLPESEYKLPSGKYGGKNAVYSYYIGNRTDCNINNVALNGMTLSHCGSDERYCFVDNYQTLIDTSSDYLTLWFGINDRLQSVPIGTIDSTDPEEFYGAWNIILSYIRTNMPFAHVGIVITQGADIAAQQTYNAATRAVAAKYGYPILDLQLDTSLPLYIHCGERPNVDSSIRTMVDNAFKVSNTNAHPNAQAHKFISYTVEKWLLGL